MNIDLYSATGSKTGTLTLPDTLFAAPINHGLMHQAVIMQQSNRRAGIAHAKNRGEVAGSTRKLYAQKHTGRARRGSVRSPLLRGGGKAFGPRSDANFQKDMPKAMRHAALCSCLSHQAKKGALIGLEDYSEKIKTKEMAGLLGKLPVQLGRRILLVTPSKHQSIGLSARNIPNVKVITASYLNPEDVLNSRHIIFVGDALEKAEEVFGKKAVKVKPSKETKETSESKEMKKTKAMKPKKAAVKKVTSKS